MNADILHDTMMEALEYLMDRQQSRIELYQEAAEAIAENAAYRWMEKYGHRPNTKRAIKTLHGYADKELEKYRSPMTRSDGSTIGPCISRDCEIGYAISPVNLACEAVVDGQHCYELWVYEDGSATMMCTTADRAYWLWDYAFAPGEPITAYDGAPRHILERLEELRQQALAKQQEESHA